MPCPLCVSTVLSAGDTKTHRARTLSPRSFHTRRRKRDVDGKTYMRAILASMQQGNKVREGGGEVENGW